VPAFLKKRKAVVATAAALGVLATGGAAYAYWGTSGSGTGSGTVENTSGTLSLSASFPTVGLHPGGSVPVTFRASNATDTDLMLTTIHAVVSTSPSLCLATDFTLADVNANQVIPANTANLLVNATGTLVFTNTSLSQDACKGATVTLALTS
jgi:hypothetical protein